MPSPASSETQITEPTPLEAEAQGRTGIDRAPEVGVCDQAIGGGGREEGRDEADDEHQQLEQRERSRRRARAVAHLPLGDAHHAVERGREGDDDGNELPQRECVPPVDRERDVEDLADPERPQDGGAAHLRTLVTSPANLPATFV